MPPAFMQNMLQLSEEGLCMSEGVTAPVVRNQYIPVVRMVLQSVSAGSSLVLPIAPRTDAKVMEKVYKHVAIY